jgi:hypothetical protein
MIDLAVALIIAFYTLTFAAAVAVESRCCGACPRRPYIQLAVHEP